MSDRRSARPGPAVGAAGAIEPPAPEISTVADDEVVIHVGAEVRHYAGLAPGRVHDLDGMQVRTLDRPAGALLSTIATVNDVHFGEVECGHLEGYEDGPILRSEPGEPPYPETMNAAGVAEISRLDPAKVIAKGDLTNVGSQAELDRFLEVWGGAFGDHLHYVRGNHDAMSGLDAGLDRIPELVEVPGARAALIDTVVPGRDGGQITADQLVWLDDVAADAERDGLPLLVFGHHHCWDPSAATRPIDYFGINPDDSEALIAVVTRRPAIRGYFAGHTHRNRVRRFPDRSGEVPFAEVACLKDFPGSWAEYRVFEGGVLQIHRRLSSPEALSWSERCRALFGGGYPWYALGGLGDRCFALPQR
jgi:3',5'-cyclic AMP phosphodiesterase CpdA